MRISLLHYSSLPVVGGVESVLAHHARLMSNAGHTVTVLTGRGFAFNERIPVRILPHLSSRDPQVMEAKKALDAGRQSSEFDRLCEQIRAELLEELKDCDLLIAHNVASLPINLALTAALHQIYRMPGLPHLILWHHDIAWMTPRYRSALHDDYPWDLLRTAWDGATQVTVSRSRCKEIVELFGIPIDSVNVIPNGVDLASFYKLESQTIDLINHLKLLEADPLLLLPVRITPRKNIELALRILAELKNDFPKAMLLVTGPVGAHNPNNLTYQQELLTLRNSLNLQDSAHFLAEISSDFMPAAVIADFYRIADALILPSYEEGFGIPVIEAAFSHIPVFCTNLPSLLEFGTDNMTYFDPDAAPHAIAEQIVTRLRAETTSRWARQVKHSYTWEQIYSLHIAPLLQSISK